MAGVRMPDFAKLPEGDGYANVPAPADDAASIPAMGYKVPDSTNAAFDMRPVSLATETQRAPTNEWNTWNSGWRSEAQIGHDDGAIGAK